MATIKISSLDSTVKSETSFCQDINAQEMASVTGGGGLLLPPLVGTLLGLKQSNEANVVQVGTGNTAVILQTNSASV